MRGASSSTGVSAPAPTPERSSAARPAWASPCLASVLTLAAPGWRLEAAITSSASTTAAPAAANHRRRTTSCAHRVHERLA